MESTHGMESHLVTNCPAKTPIGVSVRLEKAQVYEER